MSLRHRYNCADPSRQRIWYISQHFVWMKTEEWHIIVAVSCFVVDVCFQFVRIRQSETDIKKWK